MDKKEIEKFLPSLKSVMSCKIIEDKNEIQEIHVLADSSRNPKQICRDIQSVLMSRYNIDVDYKKISIAQVSESMTLNNDSRLRINSIHIENKDHMIHVQVMLELGEYLYEGTASGLKTDRNIMRLCSWATLKAVEKAFNLENCFLLEDIEEREFIDRQVINCGVNFVVNGRETILCGNCFVDHSKPEAAVKATLCAINRSVSKHSPMN